MIDPGGAAAGTPDAVLDCFDAVPAMLWALDGPQLRVAAATPARGRASTTAPTCWAPRCATCSPARTRSRCS
ncbi:hypothetical protein BJF78_26480 [Pseudonocardia sp. CNS-139]|nr:hypothetical protein BJF78_26480 [Pseudonocardia sp. CNS-139]